MLDNPHICSGVSSATLRSIRVHPTSLSRVIQVAKMQLEQIFVALAEPTPETSLVQFYRGLFEQEPVIWQSGLYAEFALPGLTLGIFQPQALHQAEFQGRAGSISLCLEVRPLEAAIERLSQLGYPPSGSILTASHGREIYAYDPAGNRLILHERPVKPCTLNR